MLHLDDDAEAHLEITLLSLPLLRTRSIHKMMLLVIHSTQHKFHHPQHPDPDQTDEEIKFEPIGKPDDEQSPILQQNTISSHTFPKTQTAKSAAEINQPEPLAGLQRPREVMHSRNPKHSEMLSLPIIRYSMTTTLLEIMTE